MSDEKTREQLEAELVELRRDLSAHESASETIRRLREKYKTVGETSAWPIERRIELVKILLNPSAAAEDQAKHIIRNRSDGNTGFVAEMVALASEYLKLRGIEVENE